ncbi:hypothetical protein V496_02595 [Pseudogymnoascus sp. VKM F-4515 (FW-2607)]|nr:hypothetical protein V496_02595 [Pseudogymnoascus sp. VKM F-4515 (FW-2607)]
MTTYDFKDSELESLRDKTVLITGASTGIGRDTVKLAHQYGANIAVGDWNAVEGEKLAAELGDRVLFHKTDVSNFSDVVALFEAAHAKFGIINAVLSNHGISNENFLADEFDAAGKLLPPNMKTIDVNLTGTVYVAKLAAHYFRKWPDVRCQLVMTGSAASFVDTPPLHLYCASKAGILGLMRSLRTQVLKNDNFTVNMIAPWMTITAMLPDAIRKLWGSLPTNETWGVGRAILLPVVRPDVNGKSLFVGGHQIVDFEDKLHETQPLWMGEQMSKDMDAGQLIMIP